jgi:Tfp pilus assembly protein PilF
MKRFIILDLVIILAISATIAGAQTDEIRQATGLPIPIGASVIYGRVSITGLGSNEPKPSVYVSLIISGSQFDRRQTNDDGYYYFLTSPRDGATLVFEANGSEIGRVVLTAGVGSTVRQDIAFDWRAVQRVGPPPSVVSAKDAYARSAETQKLMEKAMAAVKDKNTDSALKLFHEIVEKDPKDFAAWTEIGTLYFEKREFADSAAAYSSALEQRPDFMLALMNLGKLELARKQPEKAIPIFTKAAIADRNSADAFHYLGESYLQAKQGSKAVIALNESIRLAPVEKAPLHLRLAALYDAAGAKDRAANEYRLFLAKKPDYPEKEKLEKYIKDNAK